jgi:hypothetical protein
MVTDHPLHGIPSNRINIVYTNDPVVVLPDDLLTGTQVMMMMRRSLRWWRIATIPMEEGKPAESVFHGAQNATEAGQLVSEKPQQFPIFFPLTIYQIAT